MHDRDYKTSSNDLLFLNMEQSDSGARSLLNISLNQRSRWRH